jgi:hypothetical protein
MEIGALPIPRPLAHIGQFANRAFPASDLEAPIVADINRQSVMIKELGTLTRGFVNPEGILQVLRAQVQIQGHIKAIGLKG